jgi:hypothetical protein
LLINNQILWSNRLKSDKGHPCKITVDGTDFCIKGQKDEPTSWFSHKFRGPALCYEVAICIQTGEIVWTVSPFCAGRYPDITIFRIGGLKEKLLMAGERCEADKGYRGEPGTIDLPDDGLVSMYIPKKLTR